MSKRRKKYSTLEELYIDNRNLVFAFLSDIADIDGDEPLKEDMASIIWIKVFERSEKFLSMDKRWVKNYIRVMVHNLSKDYLYMEKREQKKNAMIVMLMECMTEQSVEEEVFTVYDEMYLEKECLKLKEDEKLFIRMRFEYGMSAQEIGELLEISEGAVRARQLRIIRRLRRGIMRLKAENE